MPVGRRIAAGLLGSALAVLAAGAPAAAAPSQSSDTLSVTAQRLVLEPTDRGYVGTLSATVTNNGPTATQFNLTFLEPAGASAGDLVPSDTCWWSASGVGVRLRIMCGGSTTWLEPGASQTYGLKIQVLTTPRDYAMVVDDGSVGVLVGNSEQPVASAPFTTLFRSTKGGINKPKPYVQATQTDISLRASAVTLDRQPDGSLKGRMPVTVRYGNDAPSFLLNVRASLPAGVWVDHIEPQDLPSFPEAFTVPEGRFMPGEERSVDVILTAPAGTPAGELGTGSYTVEPSYPISLTDVDPTDDTTSFTVTAN
ncbi:hypothetical protein ONA91_38740 [Micromonospora sp. DR5-3]|nr:hypothetical protein [Micromonospora sp. DR5-3]MCW3820386.1 hypothetical protein [Micromonospora sp. DR5-3]TYC26155.1 hypothetical protein FXF52_01995 [Micromonospora sp. MP36]